jgi:anti-sigma regulatory factor (Ser/Thr protein kinase)
MKIVNQEKVKNYILRLIKNQRKDYVSSTVEAFNISKSSVYNYVKQMESDGLIEKKGNIYVIRTNVYHYSFKNDGTLGEDRIFTQFISPHIQFKKNVNSIWNYAFTEMMNNAIEHSESENISVTIYQNCVETKILIIDDGIGIFKNIQRFMKKSKNEDISLQECVSLLFAGKFTTAKEYHTGEGIFFTSHIMDEFIIYSDDNIFTRNNFKSAQLSDDNLHSLMNMEKGTIVSMTINNNSKKILSEVFNTFAPVDEGFIKTTIPVAHMFSGGNPVSRSEARRLLECIVLFNDIDLDFSGVEEIGQGFTHELFVLGKQKYPHIKLRTINTCKTVEDMIKRVINTATLRQD